MFPIPSFLIRPCFDPQVILLLTKYLTDIKVYWAPIGYYTGLLTGPQLGEHSGPQLYVNLGWAAQPDSTVSPMIHWAAH